MNPPAIPLVKERVRTLSVGDAKAIATRCLNATSPGEVREILTGL